MQTQDHQKEAIAIMDGARRSLGRLMLEPCGDQDIEGIIIGAMEDLEANANALQSLREVYEGEAQ